MFLFPSQTADLYFIMGPSVGFMSSVEYEVTLITYTLDPHYYAGVNLEMGYRYYFQDKVNQKPFFISIGLMSDIIQFQFGGIEGIQYVPIQFNIFLGGGMVL